MPNSAVADLLNVSTAPSAKKERQTLVSFQRTMMANHFSFSRKQRKVDIFVFVLKIEQDFDVVGKLSNVEILATIVSTVENVLQAWKKRWSLMNYSVIVVMHHTMVSLMWESFVR